MSDEFWLTCCQCGKRFAITGQLARETLAFYAAQPGHTPDKEGGVCDECFEECQSRQPTTPRRRWFQYGEPCGLLSEVEPQTAPLSNTAKLCRAVIGAVLGGCLYGLLVYHHELRVSVVMLAFYVFIGAGVAVKRQWV